MTDAAPEALLGLARDAAMEAGRMLAARRPPGRSGRPEVTATKSSPTDVVTEMDRAAEALITGRLRAQRPGDAVLGEEGGESGRGRVRWIIDPLDGTVNYLYGLPDWAVSIAAEVEGALVATGFGYEAGRRAVQGEVVAAVLPRVRDIRRGGSAAVDLCSVAAGRVDAFYERGLNYWDYAAGGLIATEAGARLGGLAGRPASPEFAIAADPALFTQLHGLLEGLRADRDASGLP